MVFIMNKLIIKNPTTGKVIKQIKTNFKKGN